MPSYKITMPEAPVHRRDVVGQALYLQCAKPGSGEYTEFKVTEQLPLRNGDNSRIVVDVDDVTLDASVKLEVRYLDDKGAQVIVLQDQFVATGLPVDNLINSKCDCVVVEPASMAEQISETLPEAPVDLSEATDEAPVDLGPEGDEVVADGSTGNDQPPVPLHQESDGVPDAVPPAGDSPQG